MIDSNLKAAIETARSKVPRFLFRYWDVSSGGDAQLNTAHAIIPSAFKSMASDGGTIPDAECDEDFVATAIRHLSDKTFPKGAGSYFSAWSHSLAYTISRGLAEVQKDSKLEEHARIAVLDTDLCPSNVILQSRTMNCLLSPSIPTDPWTFLAYGVIKSEAYKTAPWTKIIESAKGLLNLNRNIGIHKHTEKEHKAIQEIYDCAIMLSRCFSHPYRKVVAAHVIGVVTRPEKILQEAAKRLGFSDIPKIWTKDPKLTDSDSVICHNVPEAIRGNEILRQLVVLANDKGGDMLPSDVCRRRIEQGKTMLAKEVIDKLELASGERLDVLAKYEHMLWLLPRESSSAEESVLDDSETASDNDSYVS